jgi:hypothetical protein
MTTKIYIKDKGYLDIYEDINIPLNYSLADVSDISKRNASFSKTIILPSSKNNNQILGNIFEINVNYLDCDFQINRKVEATIFQNDVPVLQGWFKLLKVNKISPSDISFDENIEYEAVIFSSQAGIFDIIKDLDVADINLSTGNHILSFDAITGSTLNTTTEGWKYIWHYTQQDKYKVSDFRPAFFVKKIWDKIFQNAGFTYDSNFLNSEPFSKLLIPTNVKDLLISDEEKARRECRVSFSTGFSVNNINNFTKIPSIGFYSSPIQNFQLPGIMNPSARRKNNACNLVSPATQVNFNETTQLKFNDDTTGINFDGSYNNYDTTNFRYTAEKTGSYEFELNLGGVMNTIVPATTYFLDIYDADDRWYTQSGLPKFDIVAYFVKRNPNLPILQQFTQLNVAKYGYTIPTQSTVFGAITYPTIPAGTTPYNYTFRPDKFIVNLNAGEEMFVVFKVITYATIAYRLSPSTAVQQIQYNFTINDYNINNSFLRVNAIKNNLSTGDEIVLNDLIPKNLKQSDFIKSFINMFNLYLIPDENNEKNIIIKTREEFYSDFENDVIDWTDKLDYNQQYSLTLLSELQEKTLNFTWKQGADEVNKRYREQVGFEYGQYKLNFDNDFLVGERTIQPIFEPTPLVKTLLPLGDEGNTFIVPYLTYGKETAPKILYDGGSIAVNPYFLEDVDSSGTTINYTLNYYNYAGHFDNPVNPTFDLNWNVNTVYFYNEVLNNVTLNNLFNLYWFDYVNLISQSKLLTAYFRLDESDISNINFAKPIWIRDSYWLLNKIVDYNASENGLTKCELIKSISSPKYNESYTVVPSYLSDVQVSNPIRSVKGTPFIQNVAMGNFENENWGYSSLLYGQDNNIMSNVKNAEIQGNVNLIGTSAENISIKGNFNFVGGNAKNVFIQGSENSVSAGCNNISLINCYNVKILEGISNVSISNLNNQIIDKNNITFTNTYNFFQEGYQIKAADIIDGGENIVIEPLSQQEYPIDLVDGLENAVYNLNESTDLVNGILNGTRINFQEDII